MAARDPVMEELVRNGGTNGEESLRIRKDRLESTASVSLDMRGENIGKFASCSCTVQCC